MKLYKLFISDCTYHIEDNATLDTLTQNFEIKNKIKKNPSPAHGPPKAFHSPPLPFLAQKGKIDM